MSRPRLVACWRSLPPPPGSLWSDGKVLDRCIVFLPDCEYVHAMALRKVVKTAKVVIEQRQADLTANQKMPVAFLPLFSIGGERFGVPFNIPDKFCEGEGLAKPWLGCVLQNQYSWSFMSWPWLGLGCFVTVLSSSLVLQVLDLEKMLIDELPNMDAVTSWLNDSSKANDAIQGGQRFLLNPGTSMYIPPGHLPLTTASGIADRTFFLVHVLFDEAIHLSMPHIVQVEVKQTFQRNLTKYSKQRPWSKLAPPMNEWLECLSTMTT